MNTTTVDRRVARTRGLLQRALIILILKKGYDAITVEEICEAADVGRSTFYAHYTSKDDLKRSGLNQLRRALVEHHEAAPGTGDRFSFSLPLFEHARDHIDLYRALVGSRGGVLALETIRRLVADLLRAEVPATDAKNAPPALPRELVTQYLAGAYMALLTWWLEAGAKLPPEQMDAVFRRLASEGVPRALS
jgi:AcrR family transcriptional regulator